MNESLEQAKRKIRSEYLGVGSIHGVGIRRSENAVCVYTHCEKALNDTPLKREIEEKAKPFTVIIVEEAAPVVTGGDGEASA